MNTKMLLMPLALIVVAFSAAAQDTLIVNSVSVTLKFENERFRALEAVFKPVPKRTPILIPGT